MRGTPGITLQPHQILRLPRKIALQNQRKICRKQLKRQFQCSTDPNTIRTRSDHELVISHPPVRRGYFSRFGDAFCIENYNISRSGYLSKFHQILRLPRKVTLRHHQMLRLPRKKGDTPTSPNAAPATNWDLKLEGSVTLLLLLLHCYFTVTLLLLLLHCYFMTALLHFTVNSTALLHFTVTFTALLHFTVTFTALLLYCYFYCTAT